MKRLDSFDLDPGDVQGIDAIITSKTGRNLAAETAQWRRRRNWFRLAMAMALLFLGAAAVLLIRSWV
jgi:hypothetical protein